MRPLYLTIAALMLCAFSTHAADSSTPSFSITPTGRILMDGAVYLGGNHGVTADDDGNYNDTRFVDGVAVPDIRLGVKAGYGKWKAKVDVGFSYGKLGLKDTYIEYDFNEANLLRGGYFVPQWGLNSETSSSMKPSYEEPSPNEFFYANPRLLALMWVYDRGQYFAGTTLFAEAAAMTNNATVMGKQAWGAQTRLVWRPRHTDGDAVQVGCSFNYSTPTADDHSAFVYSCNFPSRVSKVPFVSATVSDARGLFKMTPELLVMKGRFALETQYYFMNVARKNGLHAYRAHGAYAMLRGLILGSQYSYTQADAGVATPAPGSLECVLGYSYINASDSKAGIHGGISHDANCTFNYYINKWMIARLRYSYSYVKDRVVADLLPTRHVNTIEARLQIIF